MYRMFLSAHKSLAHLGVRRSFRPLEMPGFSPVNQPHRFNSDNRRNEGHENMRASFDKTAEGFESIGASLENLAEQVRQMEPDLEVAKQEIISQRDQIKEQVADVGTIKKDIALQDKQIKEQVADVGTIKRDIALQDKQIKEQIADVGTIKRDIALQAKQIKEQIADVGTIKRDIALQDKQIKEQAAEVNKWDTQLNELKMYAIVLGVVFFVATVIGGVIFRWWTREEFSKVMGKIGKIKNQLAETQKQLTEARQENDRLLNEAAEAYQKQLAEASDIHQKHLAQAADAHQEQLTEAEKKIDNLREKITGVHDEVSSVHTQISNMHDNAKNYFSAFEKNYGVSPESIKKQIVEATEQAKNEIVRERDRTLEAVQEKNPLTFKDALVASIENEALRVQAKWNSSFSSYRIVGFFGLSRGAAHQYKLCALETLRAEIMNSKGSEFKCSPETRKLLMDAYDYWPEEEDKRFKQNFIEVHLKNVADSFTLAPG